MNGMKYCKFYFTLKIKKRNFKTNRMPISLNCHIWDKVTLLYSLKTGLYFLAKNNKLNTQSKYKKDEAHSALEKRQLGRYDGHIVAHTSLIRRIQQILAEHIYARLIRLNRRLVLVALTRVVIVSDLLFA